MPIAKRLLRLVAIVILTPVIFLLGCQSKLIYHPNPYRAEHETMLRDAQGMRIHFNTSQGTQTAFYIPPRAVTPGLPSTLWLCFGGNGALALDWLYFTDAWDDRFAYLLVDYPSYGDCTGKPTPGNIRESNTGACAALAQHLGTTQAELQPRLAVLGHSLGAAAALMAAADLEVPRAVLLSPFTTMTDMGRIVLGWPLCHLNRHRFDNRKMLRQVVSNGAARIVIFHGTEDEVIPMHMGRELAASQPQAVAFHAVPDAYHNDILGLVADQIGAAMKTVAP